MQAWYWISCRLGPLNREPSSKVRASWAKEMRWRDRRQRCCESKGKGEKVEARRESWNTWKNNKGVLGIKLDNREIDLRLENKERFINGDLRVREAVYEPFWELVFGPTEAVVWLQISVALFEGKFLLSLPIKAFSESIEHFIRKFPGQPVAFWIERAHAALRFVTLKAKPQSRERNRSNEIGHLRYQQKASSATKSVPDLGQLQRTVMNTCTCAFVHVSSEHEFWTRTNMSDLWSG